MKHFLLFINLLLLMQVEAFSQCVANAGADQTTCANSATSISLTGSISGGATGGQWTTTGTGTFSNPTSLTSSYTPSMADITSGIATLTLTTTGGCTAVSDDIVITIIPAPTVNANFDQTICAGMPSISIDGSVTGASGGMWTTSGSGTFANPNSLTANYTFSPADQAAGSVTLTLTTTGNGLCAPVSDQVVITLVPGPTVNAGPDQTMCSSAPNVTLSGTATGGTSFMWSTTGSGSFSTLTTQNTTYTPSSGDAAGGTITMTLTVTGTAGCVTSDQVVITVLPAPTANAGFDLTSCASSANMNGTVTNATSQMWSTTGTGTFTSPTTLTTTYNPSASEITAGGNITITLTATGIGGCTVLDQMILTLLPAPTANAGTNQTFCSNSVNTIALSGSVTGASGGAWSTSGTGTFSPNTSALNATYTPSAQDKTPGTLTFTLTTTGNGSCSPSTSQKIISIISAPTVSAGPDQTSCSGSSSVSITGVVSGATGGLWTTTGSGTFAPNATSLIANYTPSAADQTTGSVTLTLTSTGNGTCASVTDVMTIVYTPAPTVTATAVNQTICGNSTATLSGTVNGATGGLWITAGSGTFSNPTSLNTTYTPSTSDRVAGSVTLTLTSTGNGSCTPVSTNLVLTLTPIPVVDAGVNKTLASNVAMTGSVSGATGAIWSTDGTGVFNPNATTINASYVPSAADMASGSVTLKLTSTGNGSCLAVSDQVVLTSNAQVCNVTITATATNNSLDFRAVNNDGTSLGSYVWDFGDGTRAVGKVQNHVYATAGSYNASVFYTTQDSSCSAIQYSMVTVAAAPITTYSLSGILKASANLLDKGIVSLFKLNNGNYDLLLTQTIAAANNGSYNFTNLANGSYILHAAINPASAYFNNYVSTYFGDVSAWGSAVPVVINNSNLTSKVINLNAYTSTDLTWNTGNDTLSGTITFDASLVLRTTSFSINPAANALVTLYNSNNVLLSSTVTDDFGQYDFSHLIAGSYSIKVEYAGGTTPTASVSASVDGNPSTKTLASTEILKQNIATGISQKHFVSGVGAKMYPNPVSSEYNIELPETVTGISTVCIYNSMGQLEHKGDYNIMSGSNVNLEVQSLSPGIHLVEVFIGDQLFKGKFTKN